MASKSGPKSGKTAKNRSSRRKPSTIAVPAHLTDLARDEYRRVAARLAEAGTLDSTDPRLIELYAVTYELVRSACVELSRDGLTFSTEGRIQAHPMVGVLNAATIRLRGLIADLEGVKGETAAGVEGESRWAGLLSVTG